MQNHLQNLRSAISTAALTALIAVGAGCASSGYQKGAATSESIQKAAAKIEAVQATANQVVVNLNDLTGNPQPDLRPQFKAFSKSVDKLDSLAADVRKSATAMESKSQAFFAEWDKQLALIKNEDIKARGEARKQEVANRFGAIQTGFTKTKEAFTPLMSDLKDLQVYLSTDLTADGVAAIKKLAGKATAGVPALTETLTALNSEFKSLGVAMAPVVEAQKEQK